MALVKLNQLNEVEDARNRPAKVIAESTMNPNISLNLTYIIKYYFNLAISFPTLKALQ